jgi:uncharacterized protein YbjT (DUF2867 family)
MMATNARIVTVFGGTGFLGQRIVRRLRYRRFPVRVASRHPDRGRRLFGSDDPTSRAPICGARALYRRQRKYPGYLAIELVTDDGLQLADGSPMLIL